MDIQMDVLIEISRLQREALFNLRQRNRGMDESSLDSPGYSVTGSFGLAGNRVFHTLANIGGKDGHS